jgi:tRNA dimethylallyltransferase
MNEDIRIKIEQFLESETPLEKIIVIYGPTACGKTGLSLDIAKFLKSEIISADSRQIYRCMDIGTGKVTPEEMGSVPHHMLSIIDPDTVYSMVDYANAALPIVKSLQARWKIPILCGGTGLYIDSVLYEMDYPDTPPDWIYRKELEDLREQYGDHHLWDMLSEVDPEYANTLDISNYRYVMRGLEVIRATGRSKLESVGKKKLRFSPLMITPYDDSLRPELYERINARVVWMYSSGLIEEVKWLRKNYSDMSPGLRTIWYKEVVSYLTWDITLDESIQLVQQHNRNYAKRQVTWNKKYNDLS